MTVAGGAPEGGAAPFLPGRHELAAAVDGVLADAGGVVFPALFVGDEPVLGIDDLALIEVIHLRIR